MNLASRIDSYRGLLCQYVILSHIIPSIFPGILGMPGTLAVWCFFVISGYLNFLSFERSSNVKEYYFKRFKRLFPLLMYSFLMISAVEGTIHINDFYTLVPIVINIKESMPLNSVLWTIIIELQLYILTPLLYFFSQKISLKNKSLLWIILFFAISSLMASILSSKLIIGGMDLDDRMLFSALPFYIFGFLLTRKDFTFSDSTLTACKILSLLLFLAVVFDRNTVIDFPFLQGKGLFTYGRLIPLMLTCVIVLSLRNKTTTSPILSTLGKATFEVYLFHGLCAYLLSRYFTGVPNVYVIILYNWLLPVSFGLLLVWFSPLLKKKFLHLRFLYGKIK